MALREGYVIALNHSDIIRRYFKRPYLQRRWQIRTWDGRTRWWVNSKSWLRRNHWKKVKKAELDKKDPWVIREAPRANPGQPHRTPQAEWTELPKDGQHTHQTTCSHPVLISPPTMCRRAASWSMLDEWGPSLLEWMKNYCVKDGADSYCVHFCPRWQNKGQ